MKKILGLGLVAIGLRLLGKFLLGGENEKYSSEWFENLTDEEWEKEREIVRSNPQRSDWYQLLETFDLEWSRREEIKHPGEWKPPVCKNWYGPSDD